jgi:LacI family transcriptional regulator
MAQAAVELIAKAMAGEKVRDVLIEFPSELVVRDSSASPPAQGSRRKKP